jgi:DNA-binding MarR family transcriptional regulator
MPERYSVDSSYVNQFAHKMGLVSETTSGLELTEAGRALGLFLRSHRVLFEAVDRELRDQIGLSFALWDVLVALAHSPANRLRMIDVTKRMCVSKSNVTQLIDKLERAGLVRRESSSDDRRLIYATITKEGLAAARRGGKAFNAAATEHLARHVTKGEIGKIVSGLTKVLGALEPESLEARATA